MTGILRNKKLKLIGLIAATIVPLAALSVTFAGLFWSSIQPAFTVNGQPYYVDVAVPADRWCDVINPIHVSVYVPAGAKTELISESKGPCGVITITTFYEGHTTEIVYATVYVRTDSERIPVQMELRGNTGNTLVCLGKAAETIVCRFNAD
ncbi:MAG: hypothetical protein O2854_08730 [Chloroflexi bacterium]|nr:hypothetical protein [Chloroflexota bacterium]